MSSNKLFVSATLISLAVFSAGCNSNLSTGHPNTNKKGTTNGTPTAVKPGSSATGTTTTLTPNEKIKGIFACENVQNFDPCMNDEYITVSSDFKTLTLEATGMLTDAPTCHMIQIMTLNAPTAIDNNGVVSYTATVGNWKLDSDGLKDNTCTAAFSSNSATLPPTGNSITLSIDGSGNVLNYVNASGNVNIELTRTSSTTGSATQVDCYAFYQFCSSVDWRCSSCGSGFCCIHRCS
jgi:hypothetical protein